MEEMQRKIIRQSYWGQALAAMLMLSAVWLGYDAYVMGKQARLIINEMSFAVNVVLVIWHWRFRAGLLKAWRDGHQQPPRPPRP